MAYPGLIVDGPAGGQHGMNGGGDSHHANILRVGSNLYAVLIDSPSLPGVFKSTDDGQTWAEQDAVNAPADCLGEPDWFKAWVSSSTIRILSNENNGAVQGARVLQFASDAWGTATATGGVEPESNTNNTQVEGISQPNLYGGTTTQPDIYTGVQRSDGDIVHVYNVKYRNLVTPETWQRIGFKSYAGGAWGAQVRLSDTSEHQEIIDAVLGSSDRIHAFFQTSDNDLKHVTIKSDDTFDSTIATITSSLNKNATQGNSVGHPGSNGTKIAIPYQESGGTVKVAIADSADAPTFTSYTVETDSAQYPPTTFINGCRMACSVLDDGRVVIGYLGGSGARKLFYRVWTSGTVGSAVEVTPLVSSGSPTVDGLNLNMLAFGLNVGFMYDRMNNLNSVWYQQVTIASSALKYGYFGSFGLVGVK